MPTPPKAVVAAVRGVRAPIIAGHVRPDGDCLGSMLALAVAAESAGRCARVTYRVAQVSQRLGFLLEAAPHVAATPEEVAACDAAIVLDTARIDRAGIDPPLADLAARGMPIINIDHHVANPGYGTANWIVPEASSTSELVYRLLVALGWTITPEAASLLYAGIHTDTHGFSLPNTTASSLHAAAELVAAGAHVSDLCERLWRSQARSEFDLARVIYENTVVTADGRIAYSTACYDEITGTGCTAADIDDQVSIPRALDGIQIAILFTEGHPERVRLNLRGEGGINVLELAQAYGGGGHAGAAGAVIEGPIDAVVADVLDRARDYLGSLSPVR